MPSRDFFNPELRAYSLMNRAIHHHRKIYQRADRPVPNERLDRIIDRCADLACLIGRLGARHYGVKP